MCSSKGLLDWCKSHRHQSEPVFQGSGLLVPAQSNFSVNATTYEDILDFQLCWQQFEEGLFLSQPDNAPVQKAKIFKTFLAKVGVRELERPEKNPKQNHTHQHWDT